MGLKTKEISIPNYERVIHATNESTNLNCIIAIHNTKLGPALGGVRSWEYNNFEEHLNDALRLSKAMNDMLMQDYAMIPLIHRGNVSAHSNTLSGVRMNPWDSELWNIAEWTRK